MSKLPSVSGQVSEHRRHLSSVTVYLPSLLFSRGRLSVQSLSWDSRFAPLVCAHLPRPNCLEAGMQPSPSSAKEFSALGRLYRCPQALHMQKPFRLQSFPREAIHTGKRKFAPYGMRGNSPQKNTSRFIKSDGFQNWAFGGGFCARSGR